LRKALASFGSETGLTHVVSDHSKSVCPFSICFGQHRGASKPFAIVATEESSGLVDFLLRPLLVGVTGSEKIKVHLGFMSVAQQTPIDPLVKLVQAGFRVCFTGFGLAGIVAECLAVCLLTHPDVKQYIDINLASNFALE
jgi:hypothetical protein